MREALLHYIWQYQLFDKQQLCTEDGTAIEILKQGNLNTDAGPDFNNAKIRIGNIVLVGNIELHLKNTDWETHQHHLDKGYNNTILHVVFETNQNFTNSQNGNKMPILSLKNRIPSKLLQKYQTLQKPSNTIPCAAIINEVSFDFRIDSFIERLAIERLENKVSIINALLENSNNNWEQVSFQLIAKYFGSSINKEPFSRLAASLPVSLLYKHHQNSKQIEALLLGQAGFLENNWEDEYPKELKKEYNYLKKLHNLSPIEKENWKFLRLRPSNFPTIKIAQLAALLTQKDKLFSSILDCNTLLSLHHLFDIKAHEYWDTHFLFDKTVSKKSAKTGNMSIAVILINAVIPLLFAYGKYKNDESICERATSFLIQLAPEKNALLKQMQEYGFTPSNAYQTQAILELKTNYCDKKICLSCAIGHKILSI